MSSPNQFCVGTSGFSPGVPGGVDGEAALPFTWEEYNAAAWYPLGFTRERRTEMWRRWRRIQVDFQIVDGEYDLEWSILLERENLDLVAMSDEMETRIPGVPTSFAQTIPEGFFYYRGIAEQHGFDGVEENAAASAMQVWLFARRNLDDGVANHMSVDGEVWYPSIFIIGSQTVDGAAEYSHVIKSVGAVDLLDPDPSLEFDADFAPAHGGGSMTMQIFGFDATSATMTIRPVQWWEWDGRFSSSTGDPT